MLPSDATSPPDDVLVQQINVEIDSIRAIAAQMRQSLEQGYRTQVPTVQDGMQPGATIGGQIAGGEWKWLQDVYSQRLTETLHAVLNIDKGTQVLAQAADIIATQYGAADGFARASASDVDTTLITAPPTSASGDGATAPGSVAE